MIYRKEDVGGVPGRPPLDDAEKQRIADEWNANEAAAAAAKTDPEPGIRDLVEALIDAQADPVAIRAAAVQEGARPPVNRSQGGTFDATPFFLGPALVAGMFVSACATPTPAAAQQVWMDRAKVVKALAARYGEAPRALGLASDGSVVEVFRSKDGATWTIIVTSPNGYSRVVASGEAWTPVPLAIKGPTS